MINPWKKIKEELKYTGYRKIATWTFLSNSGKEVDFDIVLSSPSVCVLAITADNNVILAEQFRPGPGKAMLELPGGSLGRDEDPLEGIKRELLEETGYTGDFQSVAVDYIGTYNSEARHCFVATNCRKVQEPNLDENEEIETSEMSLAEFRKYLRTGQLTDVSTAYLGLDYLGLLND